MIITLVFCLSIVSAAGAGDLDLTIVYDNNPFDETLETRWGFSCLVEGPQKTIIFDLGGEGSVLLRNSERLKIDPKAKNPDVTVYLPKSFPIRVKDMVLRAGGRLVEVQGPIEICKDVYSTGEIGDWLKEESLIVKTSKGAVIVTGCAHPGIVNIVKKTKEMVNTDIFLALGGFHLGGMSSQRIEEIVNEMKREGVKKVAPCHCSGDLARKLFKEVYGENYIPAGVGTRIKIKEAF